MRTIVYVADAASCTITAFALDALSGSLHLEQCLDVGVGVGPLAITPDCRFMYAQLRSDEPQVASLKIDPATGRLSIMATTPIAKQMVYLQTDRGAGYLLGASYTGAVFAIHALERGIVAERPAQLTPTPPHATTGRAIPNEPAFARTPQASGPRHLVFHPNARVVYVNGELDGGIGVYAFDPSSGRLEALQHVESMPPGAIETPWAADVHLTPDGRFLYSSERRSSTIAVFAVEAGSGLLARRKIVATEEQPRSFAIEPSGRFAFVAGEKSHRLAVYEIDPGSGELRLRERHPVGEKPAWVSAIALV